MGEALFPPILSLALAILAILLAFVAKMLKTTLLLKLSIAVLSVLTVLLILLGAGESWIPVFAAALVVSFMAKREEPWR